MKVCPWCGAEWPDKAKFCPTDGTRLGEAQVETLGQVAAIARVTTQDNLSQADIESLRAALSRPEVEPLVESRVVVPAPVASPTVTTEPDMTPVPEIVTADEPPPGPEAKGEEWTNDGTQADATGGFSETQWFMAAAEPDGLSDASHPQDLDDLQKKYERDKSIPEEERQKYSLSRRGNKKK